MRSNERPTVNLLSDRINEDIKITYMGKTLPHPDIKRVWVFPDSEKASHAAALHKVLIAQINPTGFFLNPTGATFEKIHHFVTEKASTLGIDFSETSASHLDGYWPYKPDGEHSFAKYIFDRVIMPLKIEDYRLINENTDYPNLEAATHNRWIRERAQALAQYGLGPDGHLAFIPQWTPFSVQTRFVHLSEETITRDKRDRRQDTPLNAITIGPANIIDGAGGYIDIVFFGKQKGEKFNEAMNGKITPEHTASLLRLPEVKESVTIFTDREAASEFTF